MNQKPFHTKQQWIALKAAKGHRCAQCGKPESKSTLNEYGAVEFDDKMSELVRDHIQPRSKGGSNAIENIQPLCRRCNGVKGSRWPWPPPENALLACNRFCGE